MENNNHHIGSREVLTLLITLLAGKVFLSFPRDMTQVTSSAAWITILFSGLFSLGGFCIIYWLLQRFPSDNIFGIARKITGNLVGTVLGIMVFCYFLIITSLLIRQFAESFILAILPRTPISVLTFFFVLLLMYGTMMGISAISRVAWFMGPYLLLGVVAIFISMANAHLENLAPVLGKGLGSIFQNALIYVSSFSEILVIAVIAPLLRRKNDLFRLGSWSISIATLILTGITMLAIATFNYNAASHLIFPVFQLTRLISLGSFIQRVEALFVFLWFFTAGIQVSALFYSTVISFSETFRIKNYRPLVFPLATLVFILSLIPQSMPEAVNLDNFTLGRFYSVVWIGVPLLLLTLALLFKKKEEPANA